MLNFFIAAFASSLCIGSAAAQNPTPEIGRSFHPFALPAERGFASIPDARLAADRVLAHVPLRDELEVLVVDDGRGVANALARLSITGKRQILFNSEFMRQLRTAVGTDWALIGIAAHEIGHHAGNHIVRQANGDIVFSVAAHVAELEADYYSGYALGKMGSSLNDAVAAMRWLPDPGTRDPNYPERKLRVEEVGRGWRNAKRNEPAAQKRDEPTRSDAEGKFSLRNNRDIYGHDIADIPGIRQDECALRCYQNGACKAFSFDKWNGRCFLKGALTTTLLEPTSILGVRRPLEVPKVSEKPAEMFSARNKIFKDNPIESTRQDSLKQCESRCDGELRCIAFSYIKTSKQCQLFNGTVGPYADQAADSGYKRQSTE
ncbi:MAG: PAN domain-containing protein [Hyphomicrobiaceae bacterium]